MAQYGVKKINNNTRVKFLYVISYEPPGTLKLLTHSIVSTLNTFHEKDTGHRADCCICSCKHIFLPHH